MKAIIAAPDPSALALIADSAIGRDAMPLFLPDQGEWAVSAVPACRIGRMGKNIAPKFAMRYVDALSILAMLHPAGFEPQAQPIPSWLSLMDSALTTGAWIPLTDALGQPATVDFGAGPMPIPLPSAADISAAIATATTIATIKTGDAILFPSLAITSAPGRAIAAAIGPDPALTLKIR